MTKIIVGNESFAITPCGTPLVTGPPSDAPEEKTREDLQEDVVELSNELNAISEPANNLVDAALTIYHLLYIPGHGGPDEPRAVTDLRAALNALKDAADATHWALISGPPDE